MNILVSACLLGVPCRYDGKCVPSVDVTELMERHNLIPVCPETLGGLTTPRLPAERTSDSVITKDGSDVTVEYKTGAEKSLELARLYDCRYAILKERSPSCGTHRIYDGTFSGTLTSGNGVTAQLLMDNGITVIGESVISAHML